MLHTKHFHHRSGPFAGWTDFQQLQFATDLYKIAGEHLPFGISMAMHKANWDKRRHEARKAQGRSAYSGCFDALLKHLLRDSELADMKHQLISDGLSMLIEDGNQNNSGILDVYNNLKTRDAFAWFKHLRFIDKKSCCAIQLADFLAFYTRRYSAAYCAEPKPTMPPFLYLAKSSVRTIAQLSEDFIWKDGATHSKG